MLPSHLIVGVRKIDYQILVANEYRQKILEKILFGQGNKKLNDMSLVCSYILSGVELNSSAKFSAKQHQSTATFFIVQTLL